MVLKSELQLCHLPGIFRQFLPFIWEEKNQKKKKEKKSHIFNYTIKKEKSLNITFLYLNQCSATSLLIGNKCHVPLFIPLFIISLVRNQMLMYLPVLDNRGLALFSGTGDTACSASKCLRDRVNMWELRQRSWEGACYHHNSQSYQEAPGENRME